jgi:hypothetical protein
MKGGGQMTLHNHKCDSCNKIVDVLFPIAILDETPTGDMMVQRWYCVSCKEEMEAEAEEAEGPADEDEEEDDDTDKDINTTRSYECGCKYRMFNAAMDIWLGSKICDKHRVNIEEEINYICGCSLVKLTPTFYVYTEVCSKHE